MCANKLVHRSVVCRFWRGFFAKFHSFECSLHNLLSNVWKFFKKDCKNLNSVDDLVWLFAKIWIYNSLFTVLSSYSTRKFQVQTISFHLFMQCRFCFHSQLNARKIEIFFLGFLYWKLLKWIFLLVLLFAQATKEFRKFSFWRNWGMNYGKMRTIYCVAWIRL